MSEANIIIGRNSVTEALKAGRSITKQIGRAHV